MSVVRRKAYWINQQLVFEDFFVTDTIECGTAANLLNLYTVVNLKSNVFADINDCPGNCAAAPAGSCMDGINTFTCMCNTGYTGDGVTCDGK